ncbi:hypothetical protein H8E88_34455 [candidate division KSB1 bacterium]|nr:hypothetical protein [candidate division KSB1 bacterium]
MQSKIKSIIENDIVLVHIENKPSFFARVEKIYPDVKPNWWRVKLLILQVPVVMATWILDNDQVRGAEFTMNGTPIRVEKVEIPPEPEMEHQSPEENEKLHKSPKKSARILSFNNNRTE